MAYSALGVSLPDLTLSGVSGQIASYGGSLAVSVNVFNRGASSLVEPLNLDQGAPSSADSGPTTIDVFATTRPGGGRSVRIGAIAVPAIRQNDVETVTGTVTLPSRPAGFPADGRIFLAYGINTARLVLESDYTNNAAVSANPVQIRRALPDLRVINFEVPAGIQPGDLIQPAIRIANLGAAATNLQGPVTVSLVASQDQKFGPGDSVLATYTVANIPAASDAPTAVAGIGDQNLQPGANVVTLNTLTVALPRRPGTYFLGVKIDPLNTIDESPARNGAAFDAVVKVGPRVPGQPSSNLTGSPTLGGTIVAPLFPNPLLGIGTGFPTQPFNPGGGNTPGPVTRGSSTSTSSTPTTTGGVVVSDGQSVGTAQAVAIRGLRTRRARIQPTRVSRLVDQGPASFDASDTSPQSGASFKTFSGTAKDTFGRSILNNRDLASF